MSSNERINQLTILAPCSVKWGEMKKGDRHTRFCEECGKNVHDFKSMTENEVFFLLENSPDDLCAQITRTRSGTVVTRPSLGPIRFSIGSLMSLIAFVAVSLWYIKCVLYAPRILGAMPSVLFHTGSLPPGQTIPADDEDEVNPPCLLPSPQDGEAGL